MGEIGRGATDGVHLVPDEVKWWSLANTVMNLGFLTRQPQLSD